MAEYIVSVPDEQAAQLIEQFGIDGCTLGGFQITGEVVRCRDCRHMFDWSYDRMLCRLWAFNDEGESEASSGNALYPRVKPDGFCAWGERRK